MKNIFVVLSIIAVLFSLTGCGAVNANNLSCDLSALKIKSMMLEGDTTGLVAAAVQRELFARGATWTYDDKGIKIVGKVTMDSARRTPIYAVVQTEGQPFAGIAYSMIWQPTSAADQLARRIAADFCRCAAGGAVVRKLSFRKE